MIKHRLPIFGEMQQQEQDTVQRYLNTVFCQDNNSFQILSTNIFPFHHKVYETRLIAGDCAHSLYNLL